MKTNIQKIRAVILCVILCLTAIPSSVLAAAPAEKTVDVAIPVSVELSGEIPSPAEKYTLTLQALDNAPMPSENTVTITGAGTTAFPAITYTEPGIHCYTVTQQKGNHERGHYDSAVYYVRVSVINAENGGLEAVVAAHTDAQMTSSKQDIIFTNSYDPAPAASTQQPSNPATKPSDPDSSSKNRSDSGANGTNTTKKSSSTTSAKTGDSNNPMLWMGLLIVAGGGLFAIAGDSCRKRRGRHESR